MPGNSRGTIFFVLYSYLRQCIYNSVKRDVEVCESYTLCLVIIQKGYLLCKKKTLYKRIWGWASG